jgi:DNA polymerase (family 10)
MKNQEVAQILFEIGEFLEIQEIPFKPQAYQQAAVVIDNLEQNIQEIYNKEGLKGLKNISSIGESIALKIEEYLKTGRIKYFEELKKSTPVDISELTKIEGLGGKRIKRLYKELGIKTIKDLQKALDDHKVAPLFGFGEKMEKNIAEAIVFLKKSKGRFLLKDVLDNVEFVENKLRRIKGVEKVSIAGSVRRKKETVGDIDFLVGIRDTSDKYLIEKIMRNFVSMDNVVKIVNKGETKSSVKTKQGLDMDLRLVSLSSFGTALQYFTGSKEHNILLRKIAIKEGLKLNEYGLFRNDKKIKGETEEEIYERLEMDWVPPELREGENEIELAQKHQLPKLIELEDIKGDFHCHSSWDGGENTIKEMAQKAISLGYEFLGISDHTKFLKIENGLNEKRLKEQGLEIEKINNDFKDQGINFKVLKGSEVDILKNGELDINNKTLKDLDYVSISVHSNFKIGREAMTKRIIKAMDNPYVKILNHPTGMILGKRDSYDVDMDKIIEKAKEKNIALEINSYRLDLNYQIARVAKEAGVKIVIGSDAHNVRELNNMRFGVYQARRAGLEKKDIINTR